MFALIHLAIIIMYNFFRYSLLIIVNIILKNPDYNKQSFKS